MIQLDNFEGYASAGEAKFPTYAKHMRALYERRLETFRAAYELGVPIYAGTDAGGSLPHGLIGRGDGADGRVRPAGVRPRCRVVAGAGVAGSAGDAGRGRAGRSGRVRRGSAPSISACCASRGWCCCAVAPWPARDPAPISDPAAARDRRGPCDRRTSGGPTRPATRDWRLLLAAGVVMLLGMLLGVLPTAPAAAATTVHRDGARGVIRARAGRHAGPARRLPVHHRPRSAAPGDRAGARLRRHQGRQSRARRDPRPGRLCGDHLHRPWVRPIGWPDPPGQPGLRGSRHHARSSISPRPGPKWPRPAATTR